MISMNKKYTTRSGLPVRVLCVDRKMKDFPVLAFVESSGEERSHGFTAEGKIWGSSVGEHDLDLIEVLPYVDFKVDEPVMVTVDDRVWVRRHFAGVNEHGWPMVWSDGKTSFTGGTSRAAVEGCRCPTPEELEAPK